MPKSNPTHNQVTQRLQQKIKQLQQENQDLRLTLLTAVEHGDCIERQLQAMNQQLQQEIRDRQRAELKLRAILDLISQQKQDLEITLQILTEHGDMLDVQWLRKVSELDRLATVDFLTQLANRRKLEQYLTQQWELMDREQAPLTVMLCDIDYFKQYNDAYGHLAGDRCLKEIAEVLNEMVSDRESLVSRYGGEEFAIILPRTARSDALELAQRIRDRLQEKSIPHRYSQVSDWVTLSLGGISQIPHPQLKPDDWILQADRCLYQAKQGGKNQALIQ
ncbi:GGDEF domain-containing protein [Desertifilum sp. FACHB-1129]|uniref:GGDEF domain-containing protein n=2 Tax=Desertifilum tharense IPPAS B-1220 TaxID=1781255 RepID=A0A1E5QIF4_9CYAN|nr:MULTISPECIES: diguanylate cyclase [Desertifilum]MCD8488669.1 GGDEF domain-containing protein [Desertifilum sp.]MDA0210129.1 GGDEF domain-containing protein [Cyanobacteria bacterium FC1]MBD2312566.1 GGDEF domain-containing protein [Desertifilum sp. FACHB-1129]MBD2320534.1 GGDEF domain-containing protein [Desertifilum sp. FACHB-866]MBD2330662.1 GGDEF domain-containing protein [Desertifilum sp. FACHB-868]